MTVRLLAILALCTVPANAQGVRGPDRAPAVGTPIPQVSASSPDGKTTVKLSEPERLTVLIFGSHT